MNTFLKKDYPVKWIRVGNISVVWANTQRPPNEREVKRIMEEFDPDKFGVLTVTLPNGSGIHHAIDGQTRAEAVRRLWGDGEMVPCLVLPAKKPEEAAEIFLGINSGRKGVQAIDRFRVAVTAGREAECEVQDALRDLGYKVSRGSEEGSFRAVSAALTIRRRHGIEVLKDALATIQNTWGMDPESVHQNIVSGYAQIVATYLGDLDRERLVSRMAKKYTPARLIGAARQAKDFHGGTVTKGVVNVLVTTYNHGLRAEARLDESKVR